MNVVRIKRKLKNYHDILEQVDSARERRLIKNKIRKLEEETGIKYIQEEKKGPSIIGYRGSMDVFKLNEMLNEGKDRQEIADYFIVHPSNIRQVMRKFIIKTAKPKENLPEDYNIGRGGRVKYCGLTVERCCDLLNSGHKQIQIARAYNIGIPYISIFINKFVDFTYYIKEECIDKGE